MDPLFGVSSMGRRHPVSFHLCEGFVLEKMNGAMFKADRKVRAAEGEHEMTVCATCGVHQTMHANRLEQKFVIDRIRWTTSQRPYEPSSWNVMSRLWIFRLGHTVKDFMFDWRLRAHTKAAHETKVFQPRQSGFASHLTRAGTHLLLVYTERRVRGALAVITSVGPSEMEHSASAIGRQPWNFSLIVFNPHCLYQWHRPACSPNKTRRARRCWATSWGLSDGVHSLKEDSCLSKQHKWLLIPYPPLRTLTTWLTSSAWSRVIHNVEGLGRYSKFSFRADGETATHFPPLCLK